MPSLKPRGLPGLGYVYIDLTDYTVEDALERIAKYLRKHPYATLLSIRMNYGVHEEDQYMEVLLDALEEEDLA